MSNSGGSWGPDGLLYCTGHDHPEALWNANTKNRFRTRTNKNSTN